jgi:hypothetical protein
MGNTDAARGKTELRMQYCARLFTECFTTHPTSPLLFGLILLYAARPEKVTEVMAVIEPAPAGELFVLSPLTNSGLPRLIRVETEEP